MDKVYDLIRVEQEILNLWQQNNYFNDITKPEFTLLLPPPNITGRLHIGHALNNTIQDFMARYKRLTGHSVTWLPGVDHAGIATQNVVEKQLQKENKTRRDLSPDEFQERLKTWANDNRNTIIDQIKQLGSSCSYNKMRYTLDEEFVSLVQDTFITLYNKNLIYRGEYITNWCARCQTVLSDEEVDVNKIKGKLYHIKYRIVDSDELIEVCTTRPETLYGDTAIGINPTDDRYKHLHCKQAIIPIVNRTVPIIADYTIDKNFGSGVMKITPAHDKTDFQLAMKHGLPLLNSKVSKRKIIRRKKRTI